MRHGLLKLCSTALQSFLIQHPMTRGIRRHKTPIHRCLRGIGEPLRPAEFQHLRVPQVQVRSDSLPEGVPAPPGQVRSKQEPLHGVCLRRVLVPGGGTGTPAKLFVKNGLQKKNRRISRTSATAVAVQEATQIQIGIHALINQSRGVIFGEFLVNSSPLFRLKRPWRSTKPRPYRRIAETASLP